MTRKRRHQATDPHATMPRWLRPKLTRDQLRDLSLAHYANLDAIARGEADASLMWQWAGGCFTWSRVAQLLQLGEPEMAEQLQLVAAVIERFERTGRVGFSGTEYQLAKIGAEIMDQLAESVDLCTAKVAAEWSEAEITRRADAGALQPA